MIGPLVLHPAEARYIDFVTGLQFFRRLGRSWLWCRILSGCLPRGRLEFGNYRCFNRPYLRFRLLFLGRFLLLNRSFFFLWQYREMALGLETAKTPLLQDLYEELLRQPEPEARRVATALELYCTGSLNLFNHPTNVDLNSRVVCIVLKGLGENLRKIAMHTTNEFVTAAVNANHAEGVATWCYFDEFHILLRDPLTASYFVAVWKMLRKKGCVPSALTQNVKDLLASREIENILDNTDFMVLLSQAQSDRAILAKQLGISEHQLSYITHSNSGEGLLFYGNVTIPFVDRFPRGEIYDLLTTRPEDLAHERTDE